MLFLDLRNALRQEFIVLRQLADVQRVNLALPLDLVLKAWLLKVLGESFGEAALVLGNDAIP